MAVSAVGGGSGIGIASGDGGASVPAKSGQHLMQLLFHQHPAFASLIADILRITLI